MRSDNIFSDDRGEGTPFGVPEAVEKLSFFEQPLDRNHAFDRMLKKNRGTQGELPHSGKRGWSGPRPGFYEFAAQILFYACCRTKHKIEI